MPTSHLSICGNVKCDVTKETIKTSLSHQALKKRAPIKLFEYE